MARASPVTSFKRLRIGRGSSLARVKRGEKRRKPDATQAKREVESVEIVTRDCAGIDIARRRGTAVPGKNPLGIRRIPCFMSGTARPGGQA